MRSGGFAGPFARLGELEPSHRQLPARGRPVIRSKRGVTDAALDLCLRGFPRCRMRDRFSQRLHALRPVCADGSQSADFLYERSLPATKPSPLAAPRTPHPSPVFATTRRFAHGGGRKNGRWMPRTAGRGQAATPSLFRESSTIVRPSIPGRPAMAASILRAPFRPSGPPMR